MGLQYQEHIFQTTSGVVVIFIGNLDLFCVILLFWQIFTLSYILF